MLCIGPQVCAIARPTGRCKHCRPQAAFRSAKHEVPALSAEIVPYEAQGRVLPGFAGYLRRKAAMHPSVCALRRITGLRYPHHTAHAEACLHSATAAPAPSRCIRRRRRSTPQPLAGEPFQVAVAHKASPARGGAAAGGGGVRRLALPLPFRTAAACVGADALHRPASLRHRKAHGTMQASSPTDAGQSPAGVWAPSGAAAQKQSRTGALGAGLFCRDAGGPFGGQRPAASGVAVSETAASGVAGRALAGASASSPRRHSRCSSSGICSATQVPSSCCVIPSSISG